MQRTETHMQIFTFGFITLQNQKATKGNGKINLSKTESDFNLYSNCKINL